MFGASTGMTMNTIETRLITLAIASASNRSRTIAMTSTRVTAAEAPWQKRAAISSGKLHGSPAQQREGGIEDDACRKDRLPPEAVGKRAPHQLGRAEANEVSDDDQLLLVFVVRRAANGRCRAGPGSSSR